MTSNVRFTPILGVTMNEPMCFLLEMAGHKILLDCGWDLDIEMEEAYESLKDIAPSLSAVILSHADVAHLGALPYIFSRFGLNCPIYCTLPVSKMGQLCLYDMLESFGGSVDFPYYDLDDVDAAFSKCKTLKYLQRLKLKRPKDVNVQTEPGEELEDVEVVPYNSGHSLGGAIWKIVMDTEEIIYAVDFDHRPERHLNGCHLREFQRPSLFITDAYNFLHPQRESAKERERQFVDMVLSTLRNGGSVLIPSDTSSRVLELLLILEDKWKSTPGLSQFSLVYLNHIASTAIEFAKSQLEYMSTTVTKNFDTRSENPFDWKHVHLCHSLHDVNELGSQPKVIFASMEHMDTGFARELFLEFAANTETLSSKNLILLTDRTYTQSNTTYALFHDLCDSPTGPIMKTDRTGAQKFVTRIRMREKRQLTGEKLRAYRIKERERKQRDWLAEQEKLRLEEGKRIEEEKRALAELENADYDDIYSDSDSDMEDAGIVISAQPKAPVADAGASATASGATTSAKPSTATTAATAAPTAAVPTTIRNLADNAVMYLRSSLQDYRFSMPKLPHLMFPYIKPDNIGLNADAYGEDVPPTWLREKLSIETIKASDVTTAKDKENVDMEEAAEQPQKQADPTPVAAPVVPYENISYDLKAEILCKIHYVDFEGRSDGRGIKTLLTQVQPRNLVIVHGSEHAKREMASYFQSRKLNSGQPMCDLIHATNAERDCVRVALNISSLKVKLSEKLMGQQQTHTLKIRNKEWGVSYVHAMVAEDESQAPEAAAGSRIPVLVPLKQHMDVPVHRPVLLGDLKLMALHKLLQGSGVEVSVQGNAFVCNGKVIVRKVGSEVFVEGKMCPDFFRIRQLIQSQFTMV